MMKTCEGSTPLLLTTLTLRSARASGKKAAPQSANATNMRVLFKGIGELVCITATGFDLAVFHAYYARRRRTLRHTSYDLRHYPRPPPATAFSTGGSAQFAGPGGPNNGKFRRALKLRQGTRLRV